MSDGQKRAIDDGGKRAHLPGQIEGKSLEEMAEELHCSVSCVRKWWRQGRDEGLKGLHARHRGPIRRGILSRFDHRVVQTALTLKRRYPRWGADRVLVALRSAPELRGLPLPSRSRLAAFFKECCPECVAIRKSRPPGPLLHPGQAAHTRSDNSTSRRMSVWPTAALSPSAASATRSGPR